MYHPETEDMLPRMAPKPSSSIPMGSNEANVRPQVPEVSILFGQQDGNMQQFAHMQQQQIKNNTQQSYASWRKQMLPKITYPAAAVLQTNNVQENLNNKNNPVEDYNIPRSNLYPLRATNTMPVSTQSNGFIKVNGGLTNPLTYHRSLENCNNNNNMAYQPIEQQYQQQSSRQVMHLTNSSTQPSPRDILTICAGTQTETISGSCNIAQGVSDINWSNLASKKDLDDVLQLVKDMRIEQLRILQMLETLLFAPQVAMKPDTKDMSVQVDINGNEDLPKLGEPQDKVQPPVPTNKFIQHLKPSTNILQTPKGKPMAQSTTYKTNSPQSQPFPEVPVVSNYQKPPNVPTGLTKSSSDTSLAMNELALKYLPNEKLAELLNELNMASPLSPTTQNRLPERFKAVPNNPSTPEKGNFENFERSSTDISNASYKYLKKYRLLPEDHQDVNDCENINENHHAPQYYTPQRQQQYDHVRNTPINQRQTPPTLQPGKCSPYAGRLPLSPLARTASQPSPQHIVDLENIKYQPKFL